MMLKALGILAILFVVCVCLWAITAPRRRRQRRPTDAYPLVDATLDATTDAMHHLDTGPSRRTVWTQGSSVWEDILRNTDSFVGGDGDGGGSDGGGGDGGGD